MGETQLKTIMITGVSRGLGRVLALEIARRGHSVVGCARSQEKLQALMADLTRVDAPSSSSSSSSKHLLKHLDVDNNTSLFEGSQTYSFVDAGYGMSLMHISHLSMWIKVFYSMISYLYLSSTCYFAHVLMTLRFDAVNNAGTINKNNKIWAVPAEEFDMVIDTNIKGTANILRHFLPLLIEKKQGIVVNISSGWGRSAAAEVAPYCASKWAIEGLSKSVAKELPPGLAIVALNPGVVNTDMLASCFGSNSALYQLPESWAPRAATMILNLTSEDNGASLTI